MCDYLTITQGWLGAISNSYIINFARGYLLWLYMLDDELARTEFYNKICRCRDHQEFPRILGAVIET